jgi:flagellar hook assembly protein FlgD
VIKFDLPKSSDVTLKIYNVLGQEIRTLINEWKPAGYHSVKWDSRNNNGVLVSSGVYLYKLQAGGFVVTKKMILIR